MPTKMEAPDRKTRYEGLEDAIKKQSQSTNELYEQHTKAMTEIMGDVENRALQRAETNVPCRLAPQPFFSNTLRPCVELPSCVEIKCLWYSLNLGTGDALFACCFFSAAEGRDGAMQ